MNPTVTNDEATAVGAVGGGPLEGHGDLAGTAPGRGREDAPAASSAPAPEGDAERAPVGRPTQRVTERLCLGGYLLGASSRASWATAPMMPPGPLQEPPRGRLSKAPKRFWETAKNTTSKIDGKPQVL